MSFRGKVILLFAGIILVGGGIIFSVWFQSRAEGGIEIVIAAPEKVQVGVPFMISVRVNNNSKNNLREASLALSLPAELEFMAEPVGRRTVTRTIGSLQTGSFAKQDFQVMPTGSENSVQQMRATLSYVPSTLGSLFEKTEVTEIALGESGVVVDLEAPDKVFAGEEFEMKVKYKNVSLTDFGNLQLRMTYPNAFQFVRASIEPEEETDDTWNLDNLLQGGEGELTIVGTLRGPDNSFYDFSAAVTTTLLNRQYAISKRTASISISPSPLSLFIKLNNRTDYIAKPSDSLEYTLSYQNNTEVGLSDVIVKVQLIGEMFDFNQVDARNGVYRSSDHSILWNPATLPQLSVIGPGQTGELYFSIKAKEQYPISRISDKNFTLKVTGEIESPTVPFRVSSSRTVGSASLETKVAGRLSLEERLFYVEPTAKINNVGPLPPKVGVGTQFTIHWSLKNYSSDMGDVLLKAFLSPNVRYTGSFEASNGVAPEYNDRTQEILWNPGKILATTGIISAPVELVFQVELLSSSNQVNRNPYIVEAVTVTGNDIFTQQAFSTRVDRIDTTELSKDPRVANANMGIVTQ